MSLQAPLRAKIPPKQRKAKGNGWCEQASEPAYAGFAARTRLTISLALLPFDHRDVALILQQLARTSEATSD
jgi:hypothetical protein